MTTYLAITIGPIYATIQQARRTRELWAASYVFSLLMRELLEVLKDEKIGELLAPVVTSGDSKDPENSQKTEESKKPKPPTVLVPIIAPESFLSVYALSLICFSICSSNFELKSTISYANSCFYSSSYSF